MDLYVKWHIHSFMKIAAQLIYVNFLWARSHMYGYIIGWVPYNDDIAISAWSQKAQHIV